MKIRHLLIASIMLFTSCEEDKNTDYIDGVIKTLETTEIKTTSATCRGSLQIISKKGEYSFIENGICYATSQNPTTNDRKIVGERVSKSGNTTITTKNPKDGEFTANLKELQKSTTYFVRAYTINSFGTFYGNEISFTTLSVYNPYVVMDNLMIQRDDNSSGRIDWNAAKLLCENSAVGGFMDWRLPTVEELSVIYAHKDDIGGFRVLTPSDNYYPLYWSNTYSHSYYSSNYYYTINFHTGAKESINYAGAYCRCVRSLP